MNEQELNPCPLCNNIPQIQEYKIPDGNEYCKCKRIDCLLYNIPIEVSRWNEYKPKELLKYKIDELVRKLEGNWYLTYSPERGNKYIAVLIPVSTEEEEIEYEDVDSIKAIQKLLNAYKKYTVCPDCGNDLTLRESAIEYCATCQEILTIIRLFKDKI